VVGVEGDISGVRLNNGQQQNLTLVLPASGMCVGGVVCGNVFISEDIRWLASVRGRVGYAWGPGLLYVTGGGAWPNVKYSANTLYPPVIPVGNFPTNDFTSTRSGPVVGAGYEWMITPNWTLRGEFLHYWFNSTAVATVTNTGFTATYSWSRFDVNEARLALNYKF
jgi:outer membrane immunogenic protein